MYVDPSKVNIKNYNQNFATQYRDKRITEKHDKLEKEKKDLERLNGELEEEKRLKQNEKYAKKNQLKEEYSQFMQKKMDDEKFRKENRINKFDLMDTEKFKIGSGNRKPKVQNMPYENELSDQMSQVSLQQKIDINAQKRYKNQSGFNIISHQDSDKHRGQLHQVYNQVQDQGYSHGQSEQNYSYQNSGQGNYQQQENYSQKPREFVKPESNYPQTRIEPVNNQPNYPQTRIEPMNNKVDQGNNYYSHQMPSSQQATVPAQKQPEPQEDPNNMLMTEDEFKNMLKDYHNQQYEQNPGIGPFEYAREEYDNYLSYMMSQNPNMRLPEPEKPKDLSNPYNSYEQYGSQPSYSSYNQDTTNPQGNYHSNPNPQRSNDYPQQSQQRGNDYSSDQKENFRSNVNRPPSNQNTQQQKPVNSFSDYSQQQDQSGYDRFANKASSRLGANMNDRNLAYQNNQHNYHQLGDYDQNIKDKKMRQQEMYKNCLDLQIQSSQPTQSAKGTRLPKKEQDFSNPFTTKNYDFGGSKLDGNILSTNNQPPVVYKHRGNNNNQLRNVGNNIIG